MRRRSICKALGAVWLLSLSGKAPAGELSCDVAVIGSGPAGLAAAIAAREAGSKNVVVLEKFPMAGGHGIVSSGPVSVAFRHPGSRDPDEDLRAMKSEILKLGEGEADERLADVLVRGSEAAVNWLADMGVRWDRRPFRAVGGLSARSISTGSPRAGTEYMEALCRRAATLGVHLYYSCRAEELISNNGLISGVRFRRMHSAAEAQSVSFLPHQGQGKILNARAVVLATGGFGANTAMRRKWDPSLTEDWPTTANPGHRILDGATGDGIVMAEKAGAVLRGMPYIQIIPFSGGRLIDYVGGEIWVDSNGLRIVSEGMPFRELRRMLDKKGVKSFWAISDSQSRKGASLPRKLIDGTVRQASSVEELAAAIGAPAGVLHTTLQRWNSAVKKGQDPDFGNQLTGSTIEVPPFFYGRESWSVHYTCGGIAIDANAAALGRNGRPIAGLFAAGETTGGVHGKDRLSGCGLTDAFVFGRLAGQNAAFFAASYQQKH